MTPSSQDEGRTKTPSSSQSHLAWQTALIMVGVCALVAVAIVLSHRHDLPKSVRVSVTHYSGQMAPDFSLQTSLGAPFKLSSLRGKAVLLTFYGNTCVPCRAETPWLVEFQKDYKEKGLQVIGVEMYGSSAASIQKFAAEFHAGYPLLVGSDAIGDLYGVGGLPTNYYINRKGAIVQATEGAVPKADMETFVQRALD